MYFWMSVGAVLALVLFLAWRHDRRHRGNSKRVTGAGHDPNQADALGQAHVHGSHQPGGGVAGIGGP